MSFKVYPIIFVAPFAARRDVRFLLLAAAACGALLVVVSGGLLGAGDTLSFYGVLLDSFRDSDWVTTNSHSQFFPHLVLRLAGAMGLDVYAHLPLLRWISYGIAAVNMGLIYLVQRTRLRRANLWTFQLVFLTIPFVLKTSWPLPLVGQSLPSPQFTAGPLESCSATCRDLSSGVTRPGYNDRTAMAEYAREVGSPPDFDSDMLAPPARWAILREVRVVAENLALLATLPRIREAAPRGSGEPVIVIPGIGADDSWTARLREFVTAIGYHTAGWGLGRNRGNVPQLIPKVVEQTERLAAERGAPVCLIGWSLGGYLARETARERPRLVDRVITLGAPVVGGPAYTFSAAGYVRKGYDLEEIKMAVVERERHPIRVPVFAVYSRSDGVVAWRACIDRFDNPRVEHHEVRSSHLGLVNSPRVFRLVAELLARPLTTG